jgi:hypothetical protein
MRAMNLAATGKIVEIATNRFFRNRIILSQFRRPYRALATEAIENLALAFSGEHVGFCGKLLALVVFVPQIRPRQSRTAPTHVRQFQARDLFVG